jgi:phage anti-repressor protein
MEKLQEEVLTELKKNLEYSDVENNYSQWILGLSLKQKEGVEDEDMYMVRVALKTNESFYVDGMDIDLTVSQTGEATIDPNYYENTPELQGGTLESALNWLNNAGEIFYLQTVNPYSLGRGV